MLRLSASHAMAFTSSLLVAGAAAAAPIAVDNFSFESPDITDTVVGGVPDDWSEAVGVGSTKYRDNYAGLVNAGVPDGEQWALITATNISNKHLFQDTGYTIVEGETYTLTVAVGEQENQAGATDIARIFLYGSDSGDAAPFAILDNIDPIDAGDDSAWIDYQTSFVATADQAGEQLVIGLGIGSNLNDGNFTNANVSFDNVRLDAAPVPEPTSLALLGLGGLLVARRRRG